MKRGPTTVVRFGGVRTVRSSVPDDTDNSSSANRLRLISSAMGESGVAADGVERFVGDLRQLREQFPGRSFVGMAARAKVSKTVLHDAVTRTDRLPSERTVRALVGLLDPRHVEDWVARRDRIASFTATVTAELSPEVDDATSEHAQSSHRGRFDRPSWGLVIALLVMVGAVSVVATVVLRPTAPNSVASPSPRSGPAVRDGEDPIHTRCIKDAAVAAAHTVPGVGTLELVFSASCNAYWGKATRGDGRSRGYQIKVTTVDLDNRSRSETATEPHVTSAYTFLLVRADPTDRICVSGSVTAEQGEKSLGILLC